MDGPPLPALEEQVLARWAAGRVPERSAARTSGGPTWQCYEPPRTANGMPGVHHLRAMVIADLYSRYKTMRGFHVPRIAGWDCHGLAVEVAVEKELGLAGRKDIEAYGIERFTTRCRESAGRHIDAFSLFIRRIGYWADESRGYRTMDPGYIESVWWSLRRVFDAGLLVREHSVGQYCPRCQTPLAAHDLGQPGGYRRVTDRAVTVRLRLLSLPDGASPELRGADLLVRTTQPWTLVANAGVAVHPGETYAVARKAGQDDRVVVAEAVFARTLGEGWHISSRVSGADLAGAQYEPAFSLFGAASPHRVIAASFVNAAIGTGLVHLAPAFGAHDIAAASAHGLPVINPLGPDGRFDPHLPLVGGVFFRHCDQMLIANLSDRGVLFASGGHDRNHPHCWRCGTPLIRQSQLAWHITAGGSGPSGSRGSPRGSRASPQASTVATSSGQRSGNRDWTLSRNRLWGTPLPIWECADGHLTCIGSLAELSRAAGRDLTGLDPHRPQLDHVTITCPQCGTAGRRVPDVIDAWYDSGSMAFARLGPPDADSAQAAKPERAQLAAADAGQAGAWFYALSTIGTLVFGEPAFDTALVLGAMADGRGQPMGRSSGNVMAPLAPIGRYGADAMRWTCAVSTPPRAPQRAPDAGTARIAEKVLLAYLNTAKFLVTHASAAATSASSSRPDTLTSPPPSERPALDRWALSELHRLIPDVTDALQAYDSARAGRRIAGFVDDLSNWYVRRSRRRFTGDQAAAADPMAGPAAFATLYSCLEALTRLLAPIAPFLSDYVWNLIRADDPADSVHLADWPTPVASLIDRRLADQMALARRLAKLGRSARSAARIGLRQPLGRALVGGDGFAGLSAELRLIVAEELNVRSIDPLPGRPPAGWALAADRSMTVALDIEITPDLRYAGLARQVIRAIKDARKRDGLAIDDRVSLRWTSADRDLAIAMARHGPLISAEVRAADLGAGPPQDRSSGAREHVESRLGLTFWLSRTTAQSDT